MPSTTASARFRAEELDDRKPAPERYAVATKAIGAEEDTWPPELRYRLNQVMVALMKSGIGPTLLTGTALGILSGKLALVQEPTRES